MIPSVMPMATIFGPVGGPYRALVSKFVTGEMQFDDSCKQVERESVTLNQAWGTLIREGYSPAEFSSNPEKPWKKYLTAS